MNNYNTIGKYFLSDFGRIFMQNISDIVKESGKTLKELQKEMVEIVDLLNKSEITHGESTFIIFNLLMQSLNGYDIDWEKFSAKSEDTTKGEEKDGSE